MSETVERLCDWISKQLSYEALLEMLAEKINTRMQEAAIPTLNPELLAQLMGLPELQCNPTIPPEVFTIEGRDAIGEEGQGKLLDVKVTEAEALAYVQANRSRVWDFYLVRKWNLADGTVSTVATLWRDELPKAD